MTKRIVYLDVAKALAMFLVVLGHITVWYDTRGYNAPTALFLYSFHSALFMFLSGCFFNSCLRKDFKTLLIEKSRQLLIPYLAWLIILLVFVDIPASGFDVSGCLIGFLRGGVLRGNWYIKLLFVYIVVSYVFIKLFKNKWLGCAASYIVFTFLPDFSFSRMFIPFFLAGFLGRQLIERLDHWGWIVGLAVVDFVLSLCWHEGYNYTNMNMSIVPYMVRTLIGIVSSILIILSFKHIITPKNEGYTIIKGISYSGSITLGIYLCHVLFARKDIWGWLIGFFQKDCFWVYFIFAIVVYIVTSITIWLVGKNKYLSFFLLGTSMKKNQEQK